MKRYVKSSFDYDTDDEIFSVFYNEDEDLFEAQGDVEVFQGTDIADLLRQIDEGANDALSYNDSDGYDIVDRTKNADVRNDDVDHGRIIIRWKYEMI